MALSSENGNGMVMPVTPMGGYGYGGFGNGLGYGGDATWLIILFLFAAMGGWGNGGFGGGFGGFGGGMNAFPWLMAGQAGINANTNAGFDNAALSGQLSAIQNAINSGFASAEVAGCNRAMDSMATAYNNQIAELNRSFDAQTANTAAITGISGQLADCCCENRLATQGLQNVIQSENAADREALSNGVRDIISSQTAGTQAILDKLCQQELDAERRENAELRSRINMLDLAQSQAAQTAALVADNTAQTQYIVNRVAPYPIPAYPVANPFGCGFYGYGYGNGNF